MSLEILRSLNSRRRRFASRAATCALLAFVADARAGDVSFRCRDRDGTWSVEACARTSPPHATATESGATTRESAERDTALRERYVAMCRQNANEPDSERCADEQMTAQAFLIERLRLAPPGSEEAQHLSACIAQSTRRELDVIDAIVAKRCFIGTP